MNTLAVDLPALAPEQDVDPLTAEPWPHVERRLGGAELPAKEPSSELVWIELLDRSEPGIGDTLREQADPALKIGQRSAEAAVEPVPVYAVPQLSGPLLNT